MKQFAVLMSIAVFFSGCASGSFSTVRHSTEIAETRQAELISEKIDLLCNPEIESAIKFNAGMLQSLTSYDKLEGIFIGSHLAAQLEIAHEVLKRGSMQEKCLIASTELKRKILMSERLLDNQKPPIPNANVDTLKVSEQLGEMKATLKTISRELNNLRSMAK